MNASLEFVSLNLETETSLNRFIYNSVVDPYIEERIKTLNLSTEEERLLEYFFKVQNACDKLLKAIFEGLQQESTRLLNNKKALAWKKKELENLRKILSAIIHSIIDYGKLTENREKRFEEVTAKIGTQNLSGVADYIKVVKSFQNCSTEKIDSKKMLIPGDWVNEWGEMHKNQLHPEVFSLRMPLNKEEILFYNLLALFGQVQYFCNLFTQQFRREFNFSLANILNYEEIKIVPEKVNLKNERLNLELIEILKHHVSPKSVKLLRLFFAGEDIEEQIEFLKSKQELMSVFLLLYRNALISPKPMLIGNLVSKSFIFPNSRSKGEHIKPDRVREFLIRTKASDSFTVLPEILEFAKRKGLGWDFSQ